MERIFKERACFLYKKPSSQTEKKDDADIEKPQNTTGADQNKTDDTKAQDGADKESDTKNSTQKKPTQRNSTKKNSTKKNSTVQKSNKSGSTT